MTATVGAPMGAALFAPDPGSGLVEKVCDKAGFDAERLLASTAYADAYAHYAGFSGFVDLLYFSDGAPKYVALFDLDAASGLPASAGAIDGVPVEVRGHTFTPLMAPLADAALPLAPQEDQAPTPAQCTGQIRPGVGISTPVGGCSLNFIFRDQSGNWYGGTAGHCFSAVGQRMSVSGAGSVGTVVYRISNGVGSDFALVLIDTEDISRISPSMCMWGGPTGTATTTGGPVMHYGNPVVWGTTFVTRGRVGLGSGGGTNSFTFQGAVASGDSGSGARLQAGPGLGVITHVDTGLLIFAHSVPNAFGTTLARAIALAEAGTGLDLTVQTAPVS